MMSAPWLWVSMLVVLMMTTGNALRSFQMHYRLRPSHLIPVTTQRIQVFANHPLHILARKKNVASEIDNLKSSNTSEVASLDAAAEFKFSYITCFKCSSTYVVDETTFATPSPVKCSVCGAQWTQSVDSILTGDTRLCELQDVSEERADQARSLLQRNIRPKPSISSFCVFVRNVPQSWGEAEVANLFAEYGVMKVTIPTDLVTKVRRGFAFVEVSNLSHAKRMVSDMNNFMVEPNRKLLLEMYQSKHQAYDSKKNTGGLSVNQPEKLSQSAVASNSPLASSFTAKTDSALLTPNKSLNEPQEYIPIKTARIDRDLAGTTGRMRATESAEIVRTTKIGPNVKGSVENRSGVLSTEDLQDPTLLDIISSNQGNSDAVANSIQEDGRQIPAQAGDRKQWREESSSTHHEESKNSLAEKPIIGDLSHFSPSFFLEESDD